MSEKTQLLYYALWIAHPVLEMGVAAVMLRRKFHRKFMFFFAYIVAEILTFAVIFPANMRHNYNAYFYLYWTTNVINIVLGFLVIYEVFSDVFRPFHTLKDLGTVLFKWAGLVMLLVAGVVSVSTNSGEMLPWMQAIVTSQRCVRIIQCGMVLFLLFFARYLGVSKRQLSFGIALGFGMYAMVELLLIASWIGDHMGSLVMDLVNMGAFNPSLILWLFYAGSKTPARDVSTVLLQPQRWEQSLTDIHRPLPADSLIPMFEGMVDRALSRTQPASASDLPEGKAYSASASASASAVVGGGSSRVLSMSSASLNHLSDRIGSKS